MVSIRTAEVRGCQVGLYRDYLGDNRVTLVTGPNGAGKTHLLTSIAARIKNDDFSTGQVDGTVARLICQTYSPFSRFSSKGERGVSVVSSYRDGADDLSFYIPLGVTADKAFRPRRVTIDVLERAIIGVSQSDERAEHFFTFLKAAGFLEKCELAFNFLPKAQQFLEALKRDPQQTRWLLESTDAFAPLRELKRQCAGEDWGELANVIQTSVDTLGETVRKGTFTVQFGRDVASSSLTFARFQSLAVLRRLKLVRVSKAAVFRGSGEPLSVASASSGEQQLLCSLLGLAGTLRNNAVVLIDEPELSLHPKWQIDYAKHMAQLMSIVKDCHVVIATHSPLIAQGFSSYGCRVTKLGSGRHGESADHQFGSVEKILVDVFESPVPSSLFLADEIMRAISEAEERPAAATDAIDRLKELSKTYSGNYEDQSLINEAIRLMKQ